MAQETYFHHSLKINDYLCTGCSSCIRACPTAALRIRDGKVILSDNKCVDCGECMRTCPSRAIYVKQDDFQLMDNFKYRVALVPVTFIAQFESRYKTKAIYSCLRELGFTHIYEVEHGTKFLARLYRQYMADHPEIRTFISPYCPAVIRLIQVRFPSLVDNIIPLKSPLDVAARVILRQLMAEGASRGSIGIFYVTPCAAKIASVKSPVSGQDTCIAGVINMDFLYNKVKLLLKNAGKDTVAVNHSLTGKDILWPVTGGESALFNESSFAVDGLSNVIEFLENLEDENIDVPGLVEMRICDQSCMGGPLTVNNRFVARNRLEKRAQLVDRVLRIRKEDPTLDNPEFTDDLAKQLVIPAIKPRSMLKLSDDFSTAFRMAEEMKRLEKALPGINCAACGAPTCAAFAEDVVRGEADIDGCVFADIRNNPPDALRKVWGERLDNQNTTTK